MRKPRVGANIMYCGHDGWFVADIIRVGTAEVIHASGPVTGANLIRGRNDEATHRLIDFPGPIFWKPEAGVFVVPAKQLREIK